MTGVPPGVVWIASWPKSGNTWMRVLLTGLIAGDGPLDINDLPGQDLFVGGREHFEDAALVGADLLTQAELLRIRATVQDWIVDRVRDAQFWKTHDPFAAADGAHVLGTRARAAIYLLRDPRDVVISLRHHLQEPLDQCVDRILASDCQPMMNMLVAPWWGRWDDHVDGWTTQTLIPTIAVRYEDLIVDTAGRLLDVARFLGIPADAAAARGAADRTRFEELRRQEAERGFRERMPGQRAFFREGRAGQWREVLTADQVRRIEQAFAPTMRRWGYALSEPGAEVAPAGANGMADGVRPGPGGYGNG